MREERASEVVSAFQNQFPNAHYEAWFASYFSAVQEAQAVPEGHFRSQEFQRHLWEMDGVTGIGPGASVNVPGAYVDPAIINALWGLKVWNAPEDMLTRARALDKEYLRILGLVSPQHNARRPLARLARIFAVLRPKDVLCLVHSSYTSQFREWLEQPSYKLGFIGQHIVLREALRTVLGPDATLEESVRQSQFSWFACDTILSPAPPEPVPGDTPTPNLATDKPRLILLPAKAQRKGIPHLSDNLSLLLSMVRAAENGIARTDLDQVIAEDVPGLNHSSRANALAIASSLGVLNLQDGAYRPTAMGTALLEGEPPSDVLTPTFVRSVFGFAQILDDLNRKGMLKRGEIAVACRGYYPRWTSDFASNNLLGWMRELGLIDIEGAGVNAEIRLTDVGAYWQSGLPSNIKDAVFLLSEEQPDEKAQTEEAKVTMLVEPMVPPTMAKILDCFRNSTRLKDFVFSDEQIGLVHAALHSGQGKRFVLLAGLSGTGKTSMACGYARAYCEALNLPFTTHYEQVSVWPDWTDPTGLLGFVNPLANPPTFHETEALRLLLAAADNPDKPYFLCLDEMNLARVEHYFAPFLSAMEGKDGRLAIHTGRDPVDGIPPRIDWPANLFIMGTVNMDETTHPFSDKVLDRAFTFEFWDVDLAGWRSRRSARGASEAVLDQVMPVLEAMSEALKPARRHFGYRTCDEILGFVGAWPEAELTPALDAAVLAKILPKVRGDDSGKLPAALDHAVAVCQDHHLIQSAKKLEQMRDTLKAMGAVRFWS